MEKLVVRAFSKIKLTPLSLAMDPRVRSILFVMFSNVVIVGTAFVRGIVLAHVLSTEQFGLTVVIITIVMALDMFADAGIDKFVVQNRHGARPDVLQTAHAFKVFGSLVVGLSIVALSYPLSILFHAKTLYAPIMVSGGIVILRGFVNLNYKLQQRDKAFLQEVSIDVARCFVEAAAIVILAIYMRNYWVVIISGYLNAVVQVGVSHFVKGPKYSFIPRLRLIKLVSNFSAPIYLNAVILFSAIQGDRLVIAALFTKSQLALYTIACAISQGLMVVLNRAMMTLMLPYMSRGQRTIADQKKAVSSAGILVIAGSTAFLLLMAAFDPPLTTFVYGPKYVHLAVIIYASSIVQMLQIESAWITTVLIATGRTQAFPIITVMRAVALPISILFAAAKAPLWSIPVAFAIGSGASLAVSYFAARPLGLIPKWLIFASFARTTASIASAVWFGIVWGGTGRAF
jgi:O-antigen/teichoic acid export membrane protein